MGNFQKLSLNASFEHVSRVAKEREAFVAQMRNKEAAALACLGDSFVNRQRVFPK